MKNVFLALKESPQRQILASVGVIFALALLTSQAQADWDRRPASSRNASPSRTTNEQRTSLVQDPSLQSGMIPELKSKAGMNQQLINQMAASSNLNLAWPPLPRLWLDIYRSKTNTSTMSVGFDGLARIGTKRTGEIKYILKTSFIMIASDRKINDPVHPKHGSAADDYLLRPAIDTDNEEIIRFDREKLTNYPRVRPEYPMVGVCVFEPSMSQETTDSFGLNAFVAQRSMSEGEVTGINTPYFSSFIQLDGNVPVFHYLNTVCGEVFRSQIEKRVMAVFHNLVKELMARSSLPGLCNPDIGDDDCTEWKKQNVLPALQDKTVGRCERDPSVGYYRCVAKGLKSVGCPIYTEPETGTYSNKYDFSTHRILATHGQHEFTCDEKAGLTCEFYRKPSATVLGRPFFKGAAQCIRK